MNAPDDGIRTAIEVVYRRTPEAQVVVFSRNDHSLIPYADSVIPDLPWPAYDITGANDLFDLIDGSSLSDVEAAVARTNITGYASTTALTVTGHATEITCFSSSPNVDQALAMFTPSLFTLSASDDSGTVRTRLRCDYEGTILSSDGSSGSYADTEQELGRWGQRLLATDAIDNYTAAISAVIDGEPYSTLQVQGSAPGLFFEIVIAPVDGEILIDLYDHSHRIAAISALKRSQTLFNQLSETLPVGVFVVGPGGKLTFSSERLLQMLGPKMGTEYGWLELIHPDDQSLAEEAFLNLPNTGHFNIELRAILPDGDAGWMRMAGSDLRSDDGEMEAVVGFVEDVSEWRELHKRIEYQASFDGLTALPNRITLVEELRQRLEVQDVTSTTGVLFIDLDGFKLINDTQGHSVGDIVLLEVAQRFRRALRPNDLIGRFGGDEFVVVASDINDPEEAVAIGRRLHDILSTPVLADGRIITVNASIGIALSERGSSTSEQLIGDADIAMYEAKASGRNRSVIFDATLRARASQRFDMTADLRHARRRRELRLEYQPIVDLSTNELVGAEALVRWEHPAMGRISPDIFIPLAEEIGLIDDVGEWVVEQACADLDRLRGMGLVNNEFTVSINASAQQFNNVAILATSSLAALDQFGLRPSNLRFELTESVPLTQIPDAANRIRQLTNYGFGLAIDDFGTGYSSLGYLTMLPFDVLKLDLSLTAQLEPGSPALAVVDSLTRMADEMEFDIVAEGIETDKQLALLCDAGVKLGQGYHISRPLPLAHLIDKLEDYAKGSSGQSCFG